MHYISLKFFFGTYLGSKYVLITIFSKLSSRLLLFWIIIADDQALKLIFDFKPDISILQLFGTYLVGWPRTMYYFAKPRPIFKFWTVLNSWDHSTSKFFSTFCCMTLFKGRASALKFSTFLHYPKREECISRTLCFVVNH